jgi:hypothetical protein
MALETRARGSVYYYRARKEGRRVVKEYVGAGQAALLAQMLDEQHRTRQLAEAAEQRAAMAAFEAEEAPIEDLCRHIETVTRATLLGAGYHRHERGEWRQRRG